MWDGTEETARRGGIGLLLEDGPADRAAERHAVALARRTARPVHAIFMAKEGGAAPGSEVFAPAARLGAAEGVAVSCHLLEGDDEVLADFLVAYRVFCLVLGARSARVLKKKVVWVESFKRSLARRTRSPHRLLWAFVVRDHGPANGAARESAAGKR